MTRVIKHIASGFHENIYVGILCNILLLFVSNCVFVFLQAKPSQAIVAAKRNARLREANKKSPEIIIKDIYHTVRIINFI